jgi:hypothetical protein
VNEFSRRLASVGFLLRLFSPYQDYQAMLYAHFAIENRKRQKRRARNCQTILAVDVWEK